MPIPAQANGPSHRMTTRTMYCHGGIIKALHGPGLESEMEVYQNPLFSNEKRKW
jgi:hypothetical protein